MITKEAVAFARRLAEQPDFGIRRIILLCNETLVEVLGASVDSMFQAPAGPPTGVDRPATCQLLIGAALALRRGDSRSDWIRCADGVVLLAADAHSLILVECLGAQTSIGVMRTYVDSLFDHVSSGRKLPRGPQGATS